MKLLIVRHGDPDYERDCLTEKGWREVELLTRRMVQTEAKAYYVSPLRRARETASLTLERLGRTAEECLWLREFVAPIWRPDVPDRKMIPWDWLPQDWTAEEPYFQRDKWSDTDIMREGRVGDAYTEVVENFDAVLAKHGYVREGDLYRAERPNRDTIVFFCHFGMECVLLSHLLNVSPMILWHNTCAAPTAVTTLYTEERRPARAIFRMTSFGDTAHLYVAGEEPSFAARFCETYDSEEERRD